MAFKSTLTPLVGGDISETEASFMNMKFGELLENTNVLNSAKIAKTQIKNTLTETATGNVLDAVIAKTLNDTKLALTGGTISGALAVTGALTNGGKTVATMDAMVNITPLNGWTVSNSGYSYFRVVRSGKVATLSMYLSGGTKTTNTSLGVLPSGYIPAFNQSVLAIDETGYAAKFLNVQTNGNIAIGSVAYGGNIFCCCSYIVA